MSKNKPIVYSCSGCSSAAQMANYIAIKIDRQKIAEMSCIAGVGGDVTSLVNFAKSGREIITIDGCPLKCCQACLKRHDLHPTEAFVLSEFKVKKKLGEDFDTDQADIILNQIEQNILQKLK